MEQPVQADMLFEVHAQRRQAEYGADQAGDNAEDQPFSLAGHFGIQLGDTVAAVTLKLHKLSFDMIHYFSEPPHIPPDPPLSGSFANKPLARKNL